MRTFVFFTFLLVSLVGTQKSQAQIAIAIAKNDKGSALRWQISWGNGSLWDCKMAAKKALQNKGFKKVTTQDCIEKCGHGIKSGYYVVVEAKHKIYNETTKTSFGLGASSSSYGDAEKKAVINLGIYDWSWNKNKHGYSVVKRGTY